MNSTALTIENLKKTSKKGIADLGKNPINAVYIVGGGVALYLIVKAVVNLGKVVDDVTNPFSNDEGSGGGSIDVMNPSSIPLGGTITKLQANTMAASLAVAFSTLGGVNDKEFEQVKNVFRGKNAVDYNLISKEFGTPRRSIFTGEASVLALGGVELNLAQWISKELNQKEINELKLISNGIF